YDAVGNVLRFHDYDGFRTAHAYTSWNHRNETTDALGHVVAMRYTASERVASVRDPGGTSTEFVYDRKDRLVEVRRNGRVRDRHLYDGPDNRIETLTGDGRRLFTVEVGAGNRPKTKRFASGASQAFTYE